MNNKDSYRWRRQAMWGIVLVVLGAVLFLDQMDILDVGELWHYWPLLMVVVGINKMIGYPTARDFTSGLWIAFVGAWLFAVFEELWGLTFDNSWPVFIIVSGVTMVLEPVIARRLNSRESNNEKL